MSTTIASTPDGLRIQASNKQILAASVASLFGWGPRSLRPVHSALCRAGGRRAVLPGGQSAAVAGRRLRVLRRHAAHPPARFGDLRLLRRPCGAAPSVDDRRQRRRYRDGDLWSAAHGAADRLDGNGAVPRVPVGAGRLRRRRRRRLAHDRHGIGAGALARVDVGFRRRRWCGARRPFCVVDLLHRLRCSRRAPPLGNGAGASCSSPASSPRSLVS